MTDIVERLRAWPAAYGEDAMSSTYVGSMAKNAADEIEGLRRALDEIVRPIWHMQERAKASGDKIDGHWANVMAKDPEYLRQIAKAALLQKDGQK
jgi:hypothetical protein